MASLVPVDDDDESGIQVVMDRGIRKQTESDFDDPFLSNWGELQKLDGLSSNFKRRANRLEKSFTGLDDAKSKKLDPLDLTGYSLFMIVQPPYNVMYLAQLYDISPFHHSAVNAKVSNIIGVVFCFINCDSII